MNKLVKGYLVIDTDQYAGNFERTMCAYITGIIGDCGLGEKQAEIAKKELNKKVFKIFEEIVVSEPDEHGCYRPCKIYPTPGYLNNGLGFAYKPGQEKLAIEEYRKECIEYGNKKFYGNSQAQEEHEKRWHEKAINAEKEYGKYPSYQSVAIIFAKKPSKKITEIVKNRAEKMAKASRNNTILDDCGIKYLESFNIIGFRWIEKKTKHIEKSL